MSVVRRGRYRRREFLRRLRGGAESRGPTGRASAGNAVGAPAARSAVFDSHPGSSVHRGATSNTAVSSTGAASSRSRARPTIGSRLATGRR